MNLKNSPLPLPLKVVKGGNFLNWTLVGENERPIAEVENEKFANALRDSANTNAVLVAALEFLRNRFSTNAAVSKEWGGKVEIKEAEWLDWKSRIDAALSKANAGVK